jgi:hypothetical protein
MKNRRLVLLTIVVVLIVVGVLLWPRSPLLFP